MAYGLKGAELESVESRNLFKFMTRFRVLPKNYAVFEGEKVFDMEVNSTATSMAPGTSSTEGGGTHEEAAAGTQPLLDVGAVDAIGAGVGAGAGVGSVLLGGRDDLDLQAGSQFDLTASSPANLGYNQP